MHWQTVSFPKLKESLCDKITNAVNVYYFLHYHEYCLLRIISKGQTVIKISVKRCYQGLAAVDLVPAISQHESTWWDQISGKWDLLPRSTLQAVKASLGKGDLYSRSRELLRRWNFPLSCKHTRIYAIHSQKEINSCSSCFSTTALYLWPWLPSRQVLILFCPKRLFSPILHNNILQVQFHTIHPS